MKLVSDPSISTIYAYVHQHLKALADADPLGLNPNITFDSVGGLDDREY